MQPSPQEKAPAPPRPGFIEAGLLAALILALVELILLGPAAAGVAWVVVSLFVAMAVAIGLVLEGLEALIQRLQLSGWASAAVRSSASLLVSVPVSHTLFEGAFASQLPGAASAHLWLPGLAFAGLTVIVWVGQKWIVGPRRFRLVGLGTATLAVLAQVVNRNVKTSELPDLHAGILIGSLVASTLALWLLGRPRAPRRRAWRLRVPIVALAIVNLVACLRLGLADPEHRWAVATRGTDARLLVRTARALLDRDDDGYAAALAGGDCDDRDPARNPGAAEIPNNAADEDCDGVAAQADPAVAAKTTAIRADLNSWAREDGPRRFLSETEKLDLLLISVDALRADVLADSPENRRDFPNLSKLSDDAIRFELAFSPAAGTDLSMSTILTGRIDPFGTVETTLAEALRAAGRTNHAVIPSEVLRYAGKTLLTRGFDDFDRLVNDRFERDVGSYSTSHRATELALAALDAADGEPVFSWVHYFDVHEHAQIKLGSRSVREVIGEAPLTTTAERYRATVQLVDRAIGELLDGLSARGRLDRTMVVLVSDHGESLGEDPRLPDNHGLYVYNPLVHVPLLVRIPGVDGRSVSTPVSLLDLAPTLAQLAGARLPDADGTSLLATLIPGAPPELAEASRPIVLNESDQHGVIVWPYKLMRRPAENLVELYDLGRDFSERENLATRQPERVRELMAVYHAYPSVTLDRTRQGRRARELAARAQPPATED